MLKFSREEPLKFKEQYPDAVIFLANEDKNPGLFMGRSWEKITSQTYEELVKLLDKTEKKEKIATCWGIKNGAGNIIGLDFEWGWVYRIWCENVGDRSQTYTVQTCNGGYRPLFFSTEISKDWGDPFKNNVRVEFKVNGFVVLGGSATDILGGEGEYKPYLHLPIKTDNNIIQNTHDLCVKILELADFLDYKCIKANLDKKIRTNHDQRLALVTFMVMNEWPDEAIHNFFMNAHETEGKNDYKKSITQSQINSTKRYIEKGGKPHPCTSKKGKKSTPLHQVFSYDPKKCSGCPRKSYKGKKDEEEEQPETVIRFKPSVRGSDFLAEMIWDGKTAPRYVIAKKGEENLTYDEEIDLGEVDDKGRPIKYRPPYNDHLTKGVVTIPTGIVECNFKDVIQDAFTFVTNPLHYDSCGRDEQVKLLTLVTMSSWYHDRMTPNTTVPVAGVGKFAPIVAIRGASESGKNRLANLLRFMAYHPYFDLSKTKIPSLFRPLDTWLGVLVIDEGDMSKTGPQSEIIHFLNSRAYGTPITRQNPDRVTESQAFESFGLTIITQRQHFDDNATESRTIPFYSQKTMTRLPTVELDELVETGLTLQNKLLYLRLKHYFDFEIDKKQWHDDLSDHRLNAALLPVYALTKFEPEIMDIVDDLVQPIQRSKKRIKATSMDGQVVNELWELIDDEERLWDKHDGMYYFLKSRDKTEEGEEIPRGLTVTAIKDALDWRSTKNIRKIIDSLSITPEEAPALIRIGSRMTRAIWFDPYRFEKQLREFVLDYKPWTLYNHLGIPVTLVTDVTDSTLCTTLEKEKKDDLHDSDEEKENLPHTGKEPLQVLQVLHDESPNIEHLRRIAYGVLRRAGYLTKVDFYNIMFEAGHQDRDAILALLKGDPRIEFTDGGIRWIKKAQP